MKIVRRILNWIETRGAVPAYAGWVLMGLTMCFWIAAANTMAGWLYVLSGVGVALLLLAAVLPMRALQGLEIARSPIHPVHAGDALNLAITLQNQTSHAKGLLWIQDQIALGLEGSTEVAIDTLAAHTTYTWHYRVATQHRGLYQWQTLVLRTGAPLGLFWSRRLRQVNAKTLVYPIILPLARCPILDDVGPSAQQLQLQPQHPIARTGHEGATRSLRPYRQGDSRRLVHWRSSARYNELRIRELELLTGGHTFTIALDTHSAWQSDAFEQAVIAAASLVFYANQHHHGAQLWTPQLNLVQGSHQILEILAQIAPQLASPRVLPTQPVVWLTAEWDTIKQLPSGSRYVLWPQGMITPDCPEFAALTEFFGLSIHADVPLQMQLQSSRRNG